MCDRVVFTSLPSPTGEGYRVVAASAGVRAQERTEITRRSPSHGALCSTDADARGVAVWALASGRVCVSLSRLAGAEHTGRGGRVWTDVLLMDPPDFLRAGGRPGPFEAAVAAAPLMAAKLGPSIEKLSLALPALHDPARLRERSARDGEAAYAAAIAALVLEHSSCVVAASDPVASLETALLLLPLALRAELNVSAGLRFSNSRQVALCVVDQIDVDTRRTTRGHAVTLLGAQDLPARPLGVLEPWLRLMLRWRDSERVEEAVALAEALQPGWPLQDILEVARVCEAIDRSEENPETLEALLARRAAA